MPLSIRTEDLRKVYTSAPPAATMAGAFALSRAPARAKRRKEKIETVALAGLSLEVRPGEIFGLLGPNGAGKSTTVGVLTTRIRPTGGRAWIGDLEVWRRPVAVKPLIGVVPQRPNLDFSLTVREILTFHGAYFRLPAAERSRRARELLERFQLAERADQLPRVLSGGMMQRLSIARAMMHDPEVLFLDEPSAGLDPQTRLLLWEIVREFNARGRTIVLTTHNMEEADELCRRVAIVDHGRIIALGTPAELKGSIPGGFVIRMQFHPRSQQLLEKLASLPGVTEVRPIGENGADLYADRGGPLVPPGVAAATQAGRTSPTSTSPNRRSRISFSTTRGGVSGIDRPAGRDCHPEEPLRDSCHSERSEESAFLEVWAFDICGRDRLRDEGSARRRRDRREQILRFAQDDRKS